MGDTHLARWAKLFELLTLWAANAMFSWITMLHSVRGRGAPRFTEASSLTRLGSKRDRRCDKLARLRFQGKNLGNFFHGWRRKLGVVTLVLACVFMGGWMRSQFQFDDLELPAGTAAYGFTSMGGGIDFYRFTSLHQEPLWTTISYS